MSAANPLTLTTRGKKYGPLAHRPSNKIVSSVELTSIAGLFGNEDSYILGSGSTGGTNNGDLAVTYDPSGMFNVNTASWTIPKTGVYQFSLSFLIAVAVPTNYDRLNVTVMFSVEKNDVRVTDFAYFCDYPGLASTVTDVVHFEAGDVVKIRVGNNFVSGSIYPASGSGRFTHASLVEI
jgi:hypothetical protein